MGKSNFEKIKEAGVEETECSRFPVHLMLKNKASVVVVIGTKNEPFLQTDRHLIELVPEEVVEGLCIIKRITRAKKGVICLKESDFNAIKKLKPVLKNKKGLFLHLSGDFYPAGDIDRLVYEIVGKVVLPGVNQIEPGIFTCTVNTLVNVARAVKGLPVTHKYVTVNGAVAQPVTLNVPLGTPVRKLVELAGGPEDNNQYILINGEPFTGQLIEDWSTPVTQGLKGLFVLPSYHKLVLKKFSTLSKEYKQAKYLCNYCGYCTLICPRNALGMKMEPHKVISKFECNDFKDAYKNIKAETISNCNNCGLCTYYACNMGLSPGRLITSLQNSFNKKGLQLSAVREKSAVRINQYLKVPLKRLLRRWDLERFVVEAPLRKEVVKVNSVKVPLKQFNKTTATPVVRIGNRVELGDLIGVINSGEVGVNLHASLSGIVTALTDDFIEITTNERIGTNA